MQIVYSMQLDTTNSVIKSRLFFPDDAWVKVDKFEQKQLIGKVYSLLPDSYNQKTRENSQPQETEKTNSSMQTDVSHSETSSRSLFDS